MSKSDDDDESGIRRHHPLVWGSGVCLSRDDGERGRKKEGRLIIRSEGLQSQLGGLWTSDSASRLRWTAKESRRCLWRSKSREVDPLWVLPERRSLVVGDWRGGGFGCGCRGVLFVDWYVDSLVYRSRMGMIGAWSEYRLDWGLYSTKRVCWTLKISVEDVTLLPTDRVIDQDCFRDPEVKRLVFLYLWISIDSRESFIAHSFSVRFIAQTITIIDGVTPRKTRTVSALTCRFT